MKLSRKTCSKCLEEKTMDNFWKEGQRGFKSSCIDCAKAYSKNYREANKEALRVKRLPNKDKLSQYSRDWYESNKERALEVRKEYQAKHADTIKKKRQEKNQKD